MKTWQTTDYRTEEEISEETRHGEQMGEDAAEAEAYEAGKIETGHNDWKTWEETTEMLWFEDLDSGQNRVTLTSLNPVTWTVNL